MFYKQLSCLTFRMNFRPKFRSKLKKLLNNYSGSHILLNPLQPGVAFLYPLKTSENLKVK